MDSDYSYFVAFQKEGKERYHSLSPSPPDFEVREKKTEVTEKKRGGLPVYNTSLKKQKNNFSI